VFLNVDIVAIVIRELTANPESESYSKCSRIRSLGMNILYEYMVKERKFLDLRYSSRG
jgi:hypothetical protein